MVDWKIYLVWGGYFLLVAVLIACRAQIVRALKRWESSDILLAGSETLFAGVAGFCVAWFKVWDGPTSWDTPEHTRRSLFALAALLISAFLAFFSKWARDRVKERDKERITTLETDLTDARTKLQGTHESFASWRRLGTQIRGLVDRKIDRVHAALKRQVTIDDLLVPHDRETQINTILQSIHGFFYFDLQQRSPQAKMRLGLYLPNASVTRLDLFYSWDGTKTDCFRKSSPEFMMINSPRGVLAEIVKTYHRSGDCQLSLIPDCRAAEREGFTFFHPHQAEHLKSMLAFKYMFELDGTPAALILSLDCNEAGFFDTGRQEEIREFLVEMLRRFEYEMLGLEIVSKLSSAHPPSQPTAKSI